MDRKRQRTLAEFNLPRVCPRQRRSGFGASSSNPIVIEDETEESKSEPVEVKREQVEIKREHVEVKREHVEIKKKHEKVKCPMCNADITHLEIYLKEAHAERCLDRMPPPKRSKIRPPLPSIKVVKFNSSKVVVDGFNFAKDDSISHYFLSHFHSDHYMGMRKSWDHGIVYGSAITINLARNKFNMDPSRLRPLPMLEITWVTENLSVVLLDANHCPGATVFLFQEWKDGKAIKQVLHTGDFRANDRLITQICELTPWIDEIYLDTTYLIPGFHFPTQESVLRVTADFANELVSKGPRALFQDNQRSILSYSGTRPRPFKFLFLIGTYTIGKEKLAIAIAHALQTKIFIPRGSPRHKTVSQYIEYFPDELITHTLAESCVHLVPLSILRTRDSIQAYLSKYSDVYEDAVGFIPTGWTFTNKWSKQPQFSGIQSRVDYCKDILVSAKDSLDLQFILSQFKRQNRFQVFKVPYSEHSSFKDLVKFGCGVPCGQMLATVNLHSQEKLRDMQQWFAAWKEMGEENH